MNFAPKTTQYALRGTHAKRGLVHLNEPARLGDAMQFHVYGLTNTESAFRLELKSRLSTDQAGISQCFGLKADAKIDLQQIINTLEPMLSDATLLAFRE